MSKLEIGTIEVGEAAAEALRRKAAASGRSIQDVVAEMIATVGVAAEPDWLRRADTIAAMTPKGVKQTDSTEILRQIRDGESDE